MKKPKTLFDQAIEIIEAGGDVYDLLLKQFDSKQHCFFNDTTRFRYGDIECGLWEFGLTIIYTRLLLARELWNDGQEKYWKQGLFK